MTGSIVLDLSLATIAFGLWVLLGYVLGRRVRNRLVDDAIASAIATTIKDEVHTTRQAATRLPPTVRLADAIQYSLREGCTIAEAGVALYRVRVRALVDEHVRGRSTR